MILMIFYPLTIVQPADYPPQLVLDFAGLSRFHTLGYQRLSAQVGLEPQLKALSVYGDDLDTKLVGGKF